MSRQKKFSSGTKRGSDFLLFVLVVAVDARNADLRSMPFPGKENSRKRSRKVFFFLFFFVLEV